MKLIEPWNICLSNKYFHTQLNVKDRVHLLREKHANLFIKESVMHLMMNRSVVKFMILKELSMPKFAIEYKKKFISKFNTKTLERSVIYIISATGISKFYI
jgi:hypothetical protein